MSALRLNRSRRGQVLIGLIIVIAIILALTAYSLRPNGVEQSSIDRADMTACMAYTSQIREAIMMYKQDNGSYPPNLAALKKEGVTPEMYSPPCTFGYDPSSGTLTPPDSRPGATPAPTASAPAPTSSGSGGLTLGAPSQPSGSNGGGGNSGGGTYIPPMAGTVGVHIPGSVTGGGPSNQRGGGDGD